jgi:hypothetical protein
LFFSSIQFVSTAVAQSHSEVDMSGFIEARTGFKNTVEGQKGNPQGLKPAFWADLGGTAEAVPFPKPIF